MNPELALRTASARILIVEDEVLLRCLIAAELRDAGFTVIESQNPNDAYEYLKSGGAVDLIFSDVHAPGSMSGLEFARRIRNDYPFLPIILTSGNLYPDSAEGVALLLPKPYHPHQAIAMIQDALEASLPHGKA